MHLKKKPRNLGCGLLWHGFKNEVKKNNRSFTVTVEVSKFPNFKTCSTRLFQRKMIFKVKKINGIKQLVSLTVEVAT